MSTYIIVRRDESTGETVTVLGDTSRLMPLTDDVGEMLREAHPQIYEKAFASLAWGNLYLDELTPAEFRIVYDLTSARCSALLDKPTGGKEMDSIAMATWRDYMAALESDPRLERPSAGDASGKGN